MTYLELCSGIGGFRQALDKLDCKCVGYSEIDKYAIKLYSSYYKDERNFGDVTKINAENLPDFDLLVGGFPCQAFSVAGKRGGFNDTRGTIFFDFARIMKAKKPKFAIFENVRGLLNHNGGKTFETMLNTLNELGYDAQWGILNTRFHGLPQNRERVYIVANLREKCTTKILFEQGNSNKNKVERQVILNKIGDYTTKSGKIHQGYEIFGKNSICACLTASGNIKMYSPKNHSLTVRKLTPKEYFRLQGFPDEMVDLGQEIGISNSQLYKMAGNAVSVPVVEWVIKRVLNWNNLKDIEFITDLSLF